MNRSNVIVPFVLASILIFGRSLASQERRMPRPYELGSAGVIYMGAGLVGSASPPLGTAIAWGYLVALVLVPSSSQFLTTITGGLKTAPPGSTSQQQRAATQPNQ